MKLLSLYRVELRRLVLSKFTWVIAALSLCGPLFGYSILQHSSSQVMSGKYIANPVLAGTVIGAVLWAVLALLESDRMHRAKTDVLVDAIASPIRMAIVRVMAIITLSTLTTVLCAIIYIPYTSIKMEYLFTLDFYLLNYLILMLPTWIISILFACALYQVARRLEIAGLIYAGLVYFSYSTFSRTDYFLRWINPLIFTYSDGFSSIWPLRIGLYTRVIWLAIALGAWVLSLLCIRRYEKNLAFSFFRGLKKVYIPVVAAIVAATGALLWTNQPFVDHGPYERVDDSSYMNYSANSFALSAHYNLITDPLTGRIHGTAEYKLNRSSGGKDWIMLNPGYKITRITYGGEDISFEIINDDINGSRFTFYTLPSGTGKNLTVEYEGFPTVAQCMYPSMITDSIDRDSITLDGSALRPKINYGLAGDESIEITIPSDLNPYLDQKMMTDFVDNHNGTKTWSATSDEDLITWFTAGKYNVDSFSAGEIGIDFAYGQKYEKAVKEYGVTEAIKDVFNYCTSHYGASGYTDENRLLLLQRSSMLGGGSAGTGYSEWFEVVLSPETLSDPSKGADATAVFIHEMIHQWWGDYGLKCTDDGLWSAEGLTVYSTYRLVKDKYGSLYAKQYYVDQWQDAVDSQNREFYYRHPEYLEKLPEKYRAYLNYRDFSINHYFRMPLMILKAEQLVGGEEKMDAILKTMYENKGKYDYENLFTYEDFLEACGLKEEDLRLE